MIKIPSIKKSKNKSKKELEKFAIPEEIRTKQQKNYMEYGKVEIYLLKKSVKRTIKTNGYN